MTNYQIWSLIIQALTGVLLAGVVIMALFGTSVRQKLFPARLDIDVLDNNGELTILDNGHRVIYYHIRVINTGKIIVKNCRVFLTKIEKLNLDGEFMDIPISVPPRYIWSPSESSPEGVDIVTERIADFGYVIDSSTDFKPTVTPILNSFKGNLKHNETFRYFIEIIAENYRSKKHVVIEVTWDGIWPTDLSEMCEHLRISKLPH